MQIFFAGNPVTFKLQTVKFLSCQPRFLRRCVLVGGNSKRIKVRCFSMSSPSCCPFTLSWGQDVPGQKDHLLQKERQKCYPGTSCWILKKNYGFLRKNDWGVTAWGCHSQLMELENFFRKYRSAKKTIHYCTEADWPGHIVNREFCLWPGEIFKSMVSFLEYIRI